MLQVAWQVGSHRDSVHPMADRLCAERRQLDSAFIPNKEALCVKHHMEPLTKPHNRLPAYLMRLSLLFLLAAVCASYRAIASPRRSADISCSRTQNFE